MSFIVGILPIAGLISLIYFSFHATRFDGEFTNQVILKYSAIFASSLSIPILVSILATEEADLVNNGFPFLLIVLAGSLLIYLHWKFYRYVAAKAEMNGRSYVAFMILGILFPLITLLVVSIFKSNNEGGISAVQVKESTESLSSQLLNLQNLKDQGVITEEEFVLAKAKLIS